MVTDSSRAPATPADEAPGFRPMRVVDLELGRPLEAITADDPATGRHYCRARVLVRLHTRPLGDVDLALGALGLAAADVARGIWQALRTEINAHLAADGLAPLEALPPGGIATEPAPACLREREALLRDAPFASVIVATRERPDDLARCLDALLAMAYPRFEIVVVDNAPLTTATADLVRERYSGRARVPVRLVREDTPGLSCAHNRGVAAARSQYVAFTDDDVQVDRHWLAEMVHALTSHDRVGCVTGLVFAAEIETRAQEWFEQYGGFGKGYARRVYDHAEHRPDNALFPYNAGSFGTGASMAFRLPALQAIGGFDPALGIGSATLGGDDLDAFFRLLACGYQLVYEPSAVVYHRHRRDYAALRRQAYGYGVGLTAYLTGVVLERPARLLEMAARMRQGLVHALNPDSPKNRKKRADYPGELNGIERRGMLMGPLAYVRSRWEKRHQQSARPAAASRGRRS